MPLGNCSDCGKVAILGAHGLCPECLRLEDEAFDQMRHLLEANPNLTVSELAERSGMEEERILRFLRDGRLIMAPGASGLRCQRCGEPIPSGRLCPRCIKEMGQVLHQNKESGSIHIADRIKRK